MSKMLPLLALISFGGLIAYGVSGESPEPVKQRAKPLATPNKVEPISTPGSALLPVATQPPPVPLQVVPPPVVIGPYTLPGSLTFKLTGTTAPQLQPFIGLTVPLVRTDRPGFYQGNQVSQGWGVSVMASFNPYDPATPALPMWDVTICNGPGGNAYLLFWGRRLAQASSMNPIGITSNFPGGLSSIGLPPGAIPNAVNFTISP